MNARRQALLERRLKLLQRSGDLRDRMAHHAEVLGPVLGAIDRARMAGRWMKEHPWVPVLAGVVVWVLKPRWAWRWASRVWTVWRLVQRTRQRVPPGFLQGVMAVFRR